MEDYKIRMIKEFQELTERYDRLTDMLFDYIQGRIDYISEGSYLLLVTQRSIMLSYIYVLRARARIENIDLTMEV